MIQLAILTALSGILLVSTGPRLHIARASLRIVCPKLHHSKRKALTGPVAAGLTIGLVVTILLVELISLQTSISDVLIVTLLASIALADLMWRWIPSSWCLSITLLGLSQAALKGWIAEQLIGAAAVALLFLALRRMTKEIVGKEALGLGDVLLIGALATHLTLSSMNQVILAAAVSGLIFEMLNRLAKHKCWFQLGRRKRFGIPFGTHLCLSFAVFA